ncbi:hypothetical protein CHS0354_022182 [Potamilus streckersoni]|uniref:Uncharacterized protein n=1 Tax=Potamilus streckersoni TaxID=2493646 RepID=A0AAE0RT81_9BIVA|nr:hypothetical protein CHS0354_022182 [Potamilus streckersoni]
MNVSVVEVPEQLQEHAHTADSVYCAVLKFRASIKRKAEETEETPHQIMGQGLQQLSQLSAVQMVTIRHQKS